MSGAAIPVSATDIGGHDLPDALPDRHRAAQSFHHDWERHFYALWFAIVSYSRNSGDTRLLRPGPGVRWAMEQTDPALYMAQSYYERFLYPIERAAVASGLTSWDDLEARRTRAFDAPLRRLPDTSDDAPTGEQMQDQMRRNMPGSRPPMPARFAPGDPVLAAGTGLPGHTRLPGYIAGHTGRILALRGFFPQNDTLAMTGEIRPEPLYTVAFSATELWGRGADPRDSVTCEAWESYLRPAPPTPTKGDPA